MRAPEGLSRGPFIVLPVRSRYFLPSHLLRQVVSYGIAQDIKCPPLTVFGGHTTQTQVPSMMRMYGVQTDPFLSGVLDACTACSPFCMYGRARCNNTIMFAYCSTVIQQLTYFVDVKHYYWKIPPVGAKLSAQLPRHL